MSDPTQPTQADRLVRLLIFQNEQAMQMAEQFALLQRAHQQQIELMRMQIAERDKIIDTQLAALEAHAKDTAA